MRTRRQACDYIFSESWQVAALGIVTKTQCRVVAAIGDLEIGMTVTFLGFEDVDNHYGIFVFKSSGCDVLEVSGDFSGANSPILIELKQSLVRI